MIISNWNKNPKVKNPVWIKEESLDDHSGFAIRGNGRSYGDASLNSKLFSTLHETQVLEIVDHYLTVSGGVILLDALNFCLSKGLIFSVIPGTSLVSIGGMIAADVHGKNHKSHGSIGNWVKALWIKISTSEVVYCTHEENSDLFFATIGGMGLTGIIEKVEIELIPQPGKGLMQKITKQHNLNDLIHQLIQNKSDFATGWIDSLNKESLFLLEQNWILAKFSSSKKQLKKGILSIPNLGFSLLSRGGMKFYNKLKTRQFIRKSKQKISIKNNFFPLDSIGNWNNLYGSKGFYQYQCVIPESKAHSAIQEIVSLVESQNHFSYLVVLKYFGAIKPVGLLSFPIQGITIAMDFPAKEGIKVLFSKLDALVVKNQGKVYLAKDANLDSENFKRMYPNHEVFKNVILTRVKSKFASMLSKRLKITE